MIYIIIILKKKETIRRNRIKKVNDLISEHEKKIGNILLDYLNSEKKIKIIGKKKINNDRAPTFSFLVEGMSSLEFSNKLVKRGIATRNGEFYAWRCLKALGIDTIDGVVRVSMVHYNNENEVKNLIRSIEASI